MAGCRGHPAPGADFVATIPPVGMILRELAGTTRVHVLLPAGASPHTYEPRPSDARQAAQATALFYVAPSLDAWGAALASRRRVGLLRLVPDSLRLRTGQSADIDPHFWTDPLTVRSMIPALADTLAALDPAHSADYRRRALRFEARLDSLERSVSAQLAGLAGRGVVLLHPSMRYLLRRHGIRVAAVVEPFPGREPSARYVAELVRVVRETGAGVVFTEPQLPPELARLVASTAHVPVATLDPLGGVPGRTTYAELVRYNADVLARSLR